jgi:uncharacterized membrane protein HdeD (DUF308 family)
MKDSNNRSIAFAVIMIIFGFILVLHPSHTLTVLARTIGWAVLLSGGVSVCPRLSGKIIPSPQAQAPPPSSSASTW